MRSRSTSLVGAITVAARASRKSRSSGRWRENAAPPHTRIVMEQEAHAHAHPTAALGHRQSFMYAASVHGAALTAALHFLPYQLMKELSANGKPFTLTVQALSDPSPLAQLAAQRQDEAADNGMDIEQSA